MDKHELDTLAARIMQVQCKGRRLVALAGAPASGKSTLAEALAEALGRAGASVQVVPMDGFHLDNHILEARGLLARKGAPETFDAAGFVHLVARLKAEHDVVYPLFDRSRDIAVAGAGHVDGTCDTVVVEGNYLLFDEDPWRQLMPLWDMSIRLTTPVPVLRERLVARWLAHGLPPHEAKARAEGNDLENAKRIAAQALEGDISL